MPAILRFMPGQPSRAFTSDHAVHDDGSVDFACSQDDAVWPWAALDPHHPGVIQALNYFASVESAMALGGWDPDKWSALTWTRWRCGEPGVGRLASGTYRRATIDGKESFAIDFRDKDGRHICRLEGRGVVFRTRDFERWRKDDKDKAPRALSDSFGFAEDAMVGIAPGERPFLAPIKGQKCIGLVDEANGMRPGHPWLNGSGDHVNSAHLAEVARQFANQLRGGEPFRVNGAEMRFDHYVELGSPFEVERLAAQDSVVAMQVRQNGRDCTWISLQLADL